MEVEDVYPDGSIEQEAIDAVEPAVNDKDTNVTLDRYEGDRFEFIYEGYIDAHMIADGWDLVGFGQDWFALKRRA